MAKLLLKLDSNVIEKNEEGIRFTRTGDSSEDTAAYIIDLSKTFIK